MKINMATMAIPVILGIAYLKPILGITAIVSTVAILSIKKLVDHCQSYPPSLTTTKQGLIVDTISEEELLEIVGQWESVALSKKEKASQLQEQSSINFGVKELRSDWEICRDIRISSSEREQCPNVQYFRCLCKDTNNVSQGLMILGNQENTSHLYINDLLTHPRNINSPVNEEEPFRVQGVGTALLREAEEVAKKFNKKELRVVPLPSSEGFYEKMGFEGEGGATRMSKQIA